MFHISVPATTANFAVGFDSLGMALSLTNTISIEALDTQERMIEGTLPPPLDPQNNLILKALHTLLDENNYSRGYHLKYGDMQIPMSKGLGSSASAILLGLIAANILLNEVYSKEDLLAYALNIEPHPDNLAPALFGGTILSVNHEGLYHYKALPFPSTWQCTLLIPQAETNTSESRQHLPQEISLKEGIHQAACFAQMVLALVNEDYPDFSLSLDDRFHQPIRMKAIPHGQGIYDHLRSKGLAIFISGSGPAFMVVTPQDKQALTDQIIKDTLSQYPEWSIKKVRPNFDGACILSGANK